MEQSLLLVVHISPGFVQRQPNYSTRLLINAFKLYEIVNEWMVFGERVGGVALVDVGECGFISTDGVVVGSAFVRMLEMLARYSGRFYVHFSMIK